MPRRARYDWYALAEIADSQLGLVTRAQLNAVGMPDSTVRYRTRTGGPWRWVLPSVFLTRPQDPDLDQRDLATQLWLGPEVALTGWTALRRHGVAASLRARVDRTHALVPQQHHRASRGFVAVERTHRTPERIQRDPWSLAPPARAVVDALRYSGNRQLTRATLAEVVQRGLADVDELAVEVAKGQRRGSALVREVVRELREGPRSAPELDLRAAIEFAGLTQPLWNATLLLPNGSFLACPDGYYAGAGVALEVDSREFHFREVDWQRTLRRHARMSAAGLIVLHFTPARIRRDPTGVVDEIAAALDIHRDRDFRGVVVRPLAA